MIGWAAMVAVLAAYGWCVRTKRMRMYHVVNIITLPYFIISTLSAGLFPNTAVSVAYGLIALWGLLRGDK